MTLFDKLQNQKVTELTKATGDGFQVGDVLTASWGYDQTNSYFYKVTKRTAKTVTFVQLNKERVDDSHVVAVNSEFLPNGTGEPKVFKSRRLKKSYDGGFTVRVTDWSSAVPWDGKPVYQTPVGMGH